MQIKTLAYPVIALILLSVARLAPAVELDGIQLADRLPASVARPELVLNGAAKRQFLMFVDVYVGALYVENPTQDPSQLLTSDTWRRMEFNMLRSVRGRKIADAFYEGIRLNVDQDKAEAMDREIRMLTRMFDQRLNPGDKAIVQYIPGKGTHVVLGEKDRGIIKSKALFDAILAIWIGNYPVSQDFKEGILGGEAHQLAEASPSQPRWKRD